jgi:transglutaminase-like putative cysteine protease
MSRRPLRTAVSPLVAAVLCVAAHAAHADGEGHVRALRERTDIVIHADHTVEQTVDYTWRAVDAEGAGTLGQQYVNWDTRRQTLELLAAETIPASGAPIPVDSAAIQVQEGMLGGVSFPEKRLLQVTFPQLAAGDAIRLRYRLVQKVPELPGGMSHVMFLAGDVIRDDSEITVRHPASMPLKVAQYGLAPQPTVDAAERVLRWHYRGGDTAGAEPNAANGWRRTPHLMLSTFADWQAIAGAYEQGAAPKAAVTPAIRALAAEVAGRAASPREATRLLYDWVRANVRYVASYVGDGGWVPNDAATVLQRRYGDCKDHVALLEALLAARGIAASPVLLRADAENFTLPDIPVMWFDHAITYVPALDTYLDATDDAMPFGLLPDLDAGKPALVTRLAGPLRRTPLPDPDSYRVERNVTLKVALDGSAQRITDIVGHGRNAVAVRRFIDGVAATGTAEWVRRTMAANGYEGDGSVETLPQDRPDVLGVRYTERIRNYVSQPEAGVLSFLPGMNGPVPLAGFAGRFTESARRYDARCEPFAVHDRMTIELPPAMQVLYVPKDLAIRQAGLDYQATYSRDGLRYRLERRVVAGQPRGWCTPEEYQALRPAMNRISRALHGRLVFVLNDTDVAKADSGP